VEPVAVAVAVAAVVVVVVVEMMMRRMWKCCAGEGSDDARSE
jgi:hypothetical protein